MGFFRNLGRPNGWVLAYAVVGFLLVAGYGYAATTGWEWGGEQGTVPQEVRSSQHGYRTYSYWHTHHVWYGPHFFWSSPYRGYRWGK